MKHEDYLYHETEGGTNVRCALCHHRYEIVSGKVGLCRARRNEGGTKAGGKAHGRKHERGA